MALRLGRFWTGLPLAFAFATGADARDPGAEGSAAAFGVAFRFLGVTSCERDYKFTDGAHSNEPQFNLTYNPEKAGQRKREIGRAREKHRPKS